MSSSASDVAPSGHGAGSRARVQLPLASKCHARGVSSVGQSLITTSQYAATAFSLTASHRGDSGGCPLPFLPPLGIRFIMSPCLSDCRLPAWSPQLGRRAAFRRFVEPLLLSKNQCFMRFAVMV